MDGGAFVPQAVQNRSRLNARAGEAAVAKVTDVCSSYRFVLLTAAMTQQEQDYGQTKTKNNQSGRDKKGQEIGDGETDQREQDRSSSKARYRGIIHEAQIL